MPGVCIALTMHVHFPLRLRRLKRTSLTAQRRTAPHPSRTLLLLMCRVQSVESPQQVLLTWETLLCRLLAHHQAVDEGRVTAVKHSSLRGATRGFTDQVLPENKRNFT